MTVYNSIEEAVKDTNAAINEIAKLQAENDRLRKAILTWWRGSPEDTGSEVQLRSVATELLEVK
jgi:hypothetical protein